MKLNANVYIDDIRLDISSYAILINRNWSLCNCLQTFSITLDPTVKDYLALSGLVLKPSLDVEIWEFGVKVFTGFITTVKYSRKPEPLIEIQGADKFKYAKDYFIDEDFGVTNGETVAYWVSRLLDLCGLDYSIDSSDANTMTVGPGIEISMRTVEDAIQELLSYSSSYVYTSPSGRVHISNGTRSSNIKFKTGITTVYDHNDPTFIEGGNVKRAYHQTNDTNTRDIVKVWGWKGSSAFLNAHESPYLTATETIDLGLPVPKTVLYASNYIQTQEAANNLANRIISEVGKFDSVKTVECIGNPAIEVGHRVDIDLDLESEHLIGSAKVTTISSNMGQDGYIMNIKMDEFCPKFAAWSIATPPQVFYAGTTAHGVFKSLDGGLTWFDYNSGLTTGRKSVKMLAATSEDEVMAIINGSLWYTTTSGMTLSGIWTRRYLGIPTNDAGDSPAPSAGSPFAVDSSGSPNEFNVLSTFKIGTGMIPISVSGIYIQDPIKYRSWAWTTEDTGLTWDSAQISYDTVSGIDYDFAGLDLSSRYGTPYVLANKGVDSNPGLIATHFPLNQVVWDGHDFHFTVGGDAGTYTQRDNPVYSIHFGIQEWDFMRDSAGKPTYRLIGTSPNRIFEINIVGRDISGWPVLALGYPVTRKINYLIQSGGVILDNFSTIPTYQTSQIDAANMYQVAGNGFYWGKITIPEATWGDSFWIKFSFYTKYMAVLNAIYSYSFRTYSGESPFYPEEDTWPYPYTKWPIFQSGQMTDDEYPLALGAGTIQVILDELT